ncbi:MAG: hypothetical protein JSS81_11115 [Acidobacteria bacterium]|nr:hypothetical protein [Acidobacteriota bacterium]
MTNEIALEENPADPTAHAPMTVGEAWASLTRDPGQFIRHWNYKGAILSGALRAGVFLVSYLKGRESLELALVVALVQFSYRFLFAGFGGAMIQAFRRVDPPWKALVNILVIVPVISHLLEFAVQTGFTYLTGTPNHIGESIVLSICVTVFSALFSLFIMRRNVMIVGEEGSRSLLSDIIRMPLMIYYFMAFIPNEIAMMIRRRKLVPAILTVLGWGVFSHMICWAVTNKFSWTYGGGKIMPVVRFWAVDGIILMILATFLAYLFLPPKESHF